MAFYDFMFSFLNAASHNVGPVRQNDQHEKWVGSVHLLATKTLTGEKFNFWK